MVLQDDRIPISKRFLRTMQMIFNKNVQFFIKKILISIYGIIVSKTLYLLENTYTLFYKLFSCNLNRGRYNKLCEYEI